jgi:hypothetical protein
MKKKQQKKMSVGYYSIIVWGAFILLLYIAHNS